MIVDYVEFQHSEAQVKLCKKYSRELFERALELRYAGRMKLHVSTVSISSYNSITLFLRWRGHTYMEAMLFGTSENIYV